MDLKQVAAIFSVCSSALTAFLFFLYKSKASPHEKKVLFFPGARDKSASEIDCIVSELSKSRTSLDLCLYLLTNPILVKAISKLMLLGVKIRLIVDKSADDNATGSSVNKLRQQGAFVRMNFGEHKNLMHHKFAIIDKKTVIFGSFNWTRQAADGNKESLIITDDPELVNPFIDEFEKLWREFS